MTLTATWSDATHEFVGWGGGCSGTSPTCVLTMDGDKSVTAEFRERPVEAPPAPGNAGAVLAAGTFTITWDEVAGADRYRVEYRAGTTGEWSELSDEPATDTSVTWTPEALACGQIYAFRVAARGDGVTYGAAWGEATQTAAPTAVCEGE